MSETIQKVKRHVKTSDGYNTLSQWTSSDTVDVNGTTLTSKLGTMDSSISGKIDSSKIGVASGVAQLDETGTVPSSQLPSYVDDVLEYDTKSVFPTTGESGKIYTDKSTNITYRWGGSAYVAIGSDLALGETSSTAYAGDKGKAVTDGLATHKADTTAHITSDERTAWNGKYTKPSTGIPASDLASGVIPSTDNFMTKANPTGTGSFSLNRKANTTVGNNSFAEGYSTTASGLASHAEGGLTTASEQGSHAEGSSTTASGKYSHAEGSDTTASEQCSHAEGYNTTASEQCSHAEGYNTTASGIASHAEGYYTIANGFYQHAQGKYNVEDTNDTYAHIVGGGTSSSNRKNIHTIDWSGNAEFSGTVTADGKVLGVKKLTQAEYDALTDTEKNNGVTYIITDAIPSTESLASNIAYDGTTSGLSSTDVQSAIDEMNTPSTTTATCLVNGTFDRNLVRKVGNSVFISLRVYGSTDGNNSSIAFSLPEGYRPKVIQHVYGFLQNGTTLLPTVFQIGTSGYLQPMYGGTTACSQFCVCGCYSLK